MVDESSLTQSSLKVILHVILLCCLKEKQSKAGTSPRFSLRLAFSKRQEATELALLWVCPCSVMTSELSAKEFGKTMKMSLSPCQPGQERRLAWLLPCPQRVQQ